ncbi:MAG TPA: MFS transporter [Terrimicrobiaceae bacterium]|nr:MFS transporter [Terrimicrobiaceae bacterium]
MIAAVVPAMDRQTQTEQPGARRALALLLGLNLLCYVDRYILAAVEPDIRKAFFAPEDPDAMAKTGALATAFLVSYMILSPVFGWFADRHSRWVVIAIGAAVWSLATAGSGWAPTFGILLLSRIVVGTGEAAYGPAAPTLLADLFPPERRGLTLAWFFAAIPFGSAIGYLFGGMVSGAFGWRAAFHFAAIPGLILAGLCLLMKDRSHTTRAKPRATLKDYRGLLRIRSYLYNVGALTALTFAIGGMSFWAPAYFLDQRGQADLERVNLIFGGITAIAGLLATLLGGWLGDRLSRRHPGAYFYVSALSMFLAFPSTLAMLYAPFPLAWILCFLAIFFLFFNTSPANTAIANVTKPGIRATAFAVSIFVMHALGDAISPPLIGAIADRWNLQIGFLVVSCMMLLAGILWLAGARFLGADTEAAGRQ